jgi:membrane protein implicated in regulation of membrane protease activity
VAGFIVIGSVGLAIVLGSLILGDILDGIFSAFDLDFGGGILSGPVLGSFLASFGFGAALIMISTGAGATAGAFGGLASGAVVGGVALVMMRQLMNMPTDSPMDAADLVGATGNVITRIPAEGFGEVTIRHLGQPQKLNARALEPIEAGASVQVTAVLSTSSVMVARVT